MNSYDFGHNDANSQGFRRNIVINDVPVQTNMTMTMTMMMVVVMMMMVADDDDDDSILIRNCIHVHNVHHCSYFSAFSQFSSYYKFS